MSGILSYEEKQKLFAKEKREIRAILMSAGRDGVPLEDLNRDYEDLSGMPIPVGKLGYNSLLEFLQAMPEVVNIVRFGKITMLFAKSHYSTDRIEEMILRTNTKKHSRPTRFGGVIPVDMQSDDQRRKLRRGNSSSAAKKTAVSEVQKNLVKERILEILRENNQNLDYLYVVQRYYERHKEKLDLRETFACSAREVIREHFSDKIHLIEQPQSGRMWLALKEPRPLPILQYGVEHHRPAFFSPVVPWFYQPPSYFRASPSADTSERVVPESAAPAPTARGRGFMSRLLFAKEVIPAPEPLALQYLQPIPQTQNDQYTQWANWKKDLGFPPSPVSVTQPQSRSEQTPPVPPSKETSKENVVSDERNLPSASGFAKSASQKLFAPIGKQVPKNGNEEMTNKPSEKQHRVGGTETPTITPTGRQSKVLGDMDVPSDGLSSKADTLRIANGAPVSKTKQKQVDEKLESRKKELKDCVLAMFQEDPDEALTTRRIQKNLTDAMNVAHRRDFPFKDLLEMLLTSGFTVERLHAKTKDLMMKPIQETGPNDIPSYVGFGEKFLWQEVPFSAEALERMDVDSTERFLPVCLAQYYSPDLFYVVIEENMVKFKQMLNRVKTYYQLEESKRLEISVDVLKRSMNLVVAAPYQHRGYHRAEVKEIYADGSASVFFVDFGTTESTKPGELRWLTKELFDCMPAQAIQACIQGLRPPDGGWSMKTETRFLELVNGESDSCLGFVASIENGAVQFRDLLKKKNNLEEDVSIIEILISEGLAQADSSDTEGDVDDESWNQHENDEFDDDLLKKIEEELNATPSGDSSQVEDAEFILRVLEMKRKRLAKENSERRSGEKMSGDLVAQLATCDSQTMKQFE